MVLGTTTWGNRNTNRLIRTRDAAKELGIYQPSIINYGPGGVVHFLINYLPSGNKSDWNMPEKILRGIVKLSETTLRKTNIFSLKTSEPQEIIYMFKDLKPQLLYIIDKEEKVIDAAKEIFQQYNQPILINYFTQDICENPFEKQADIVIAYNIIQRTKYPEISLENIAKSTRIGGLLSTTSDITPKGFKKINEDLYQRMN